MKINKFFMISFCVSILLCLSFSCAYAIENQTITLSEDWRITSDLDLNVPTDTILTIQSDKYFIYEMGGKLINTGEGNVVFQDTILYPMDNDDVAEDISINGIWDTEESNKLINKRSRKVIAPTADTTIYTYNGTEQTYTIEENEEYEVSGNKETNANEDGYIVTVSLKDKTNTKWADTNDTEDKTFNFIIKKATIKITADNKSVYVNSTVPDTSTLTYKVEGLVNDETLKTNPTLTYKTTPDMTAVGTVQIVPSLAEAPDGGNYNDIQYVEGTLTINKRSSGGGSSSTTKYEITVTAGNGGEISPSTTKVKRGDDKKFTITADEGYEIEDVLVDGDSVGVVETYTFENVKSKHTIKATFKEVEDEYEIPEVIEPEVTTPEYNDIVEDVWYEEAVNYVTEEGLMSGTGDGNFSPNENTTRSMIVTILYNAEGRPEVEEDAGFSDVKSGAWYYAPISWAKGNNIINGIGNNMFGTNNDVTREQLVTIIYNYAKSKGIDTSVGENTNILSYNDAFEISEYAIPAFQWACGEGIISGVGDGYLSPKTSATRAQVATIIMNFMKNN